jgi:hypothetical protein
MGPCEPTLLAAVLLAAQVTANPVPSPTPTATLHQIFDAAFRRLQSYPVPSYAVWTATWQIRATTLGFAPQESSHVEVHRYAVRMSDGMENVSDPIAGGKLPPAMILPEFLGPFAWTIRSSVRPPPTHSSVSMQPDLSGLRTIATVVTVAQLPYAVALVGTDSIEGRPTYHLQLRPLSDPQNHNLRDLWIDTQTFDLRKAHFVGMYAPTPRDLPSHSDVTAYFREVLSCWVVTRAVWTYLNDVASFTFDVQNNEIALPATLPDWLFNAAEYRRHEMAGEPDYIGILLEQMRSRQ